VDAVNVIRTLAAVLAAVASYYAFRFVWHYRHVNWRATPWGRHVMAFSRIIAVVCAVAALLRIFVLLGLEWPLGTAIFSLLTFGAVAYEMRRRMYLEKRVQNPRINHPEDSPL
jgi:hypothetical protein